MEYNEILKTLKSLSNPEAVAGMARFGIKPENILRHFYSQPEKDSRTNWQKPFTCRKAMGIRNPRSQDFGVYD